jgi:transposase
MDMSSLDKQSVRAEFDTIKASFKKLSKRDAPSPEMVALINALFLLFNIVLSIFLEKHTKKTSANSSIPSSQSEEDETTPKKKGKSAKQKKEKLLVSGNTRTVETVEISQVLKCKFCGCDLSNVSCAHIERRTQIDIIFEKTVVHVDAEVKNCPSCSTTTKGSYPSNMPGPLQYGNGIKSNHM